jgi:hypothetical protein
MVWSWRTVREGLGGVRIPRGANESKAFSNRCAVYRRAFSLATFDVLGPYILPTRSGRAGGRQIAIHDRDIREQFWDEVECWDRPGCYVFAIRHGRGITPYYAGRTFGTFYGECFQPHKLLKYDRVLSNIRRGTPIMFFLPLTRTRGRMNERAIAEVFSSNETTRRA